MARVKERISTREWLPPWLRHQHIARYVWATRYTHGRVVADAACGTGYGADILAGNGAAHVDGFDVSAEAIAAAVRAYRSPSIAFNVADIRALPAPDDKYDCFVSFETIEHIERPHEYLAEARRVLRPGGHFLCSTPNRCVTNPGTAITDKPFNRFHFREYLPTELRAELGVYFSHVELYGQSPYSPAYVDGLNRLGRRSPTAAFRLHQLVKLCGVPWESRDRHYPRPILRNAVPEMLIAVCRK